PRGAAELPHREGPPRAEHGAPDVNWRKRLTPFPPLPAPAGAAGGGCSMLKSLAEFRRPQATEESKIVFPAACTSEKHFARSERRRDRLQRSRGAERSESPLAEKASAFFDRLSPPALPAGAAFCHVFRRAK